MTDCKELGSPQRRHAPATGVVVRETDGNGFVTKVELEDTSNAWHTIWTGTDPAQPGKAADFILRFAATSYSVQAVRLTVDTDHTADEFEEIDAVRLLTGGSPSSTTTAVVTLDAAPTAADDWATTNQGQTAYVHVLDNDSDPDGDALAVSVTSGSSHATYSISGGVLAYTPTSGYSGSDSLTYQIDDVTATV
jgi:hypothetical protein